MDVGLFLPGLAVQSVTDLRGASRVPPPRPAAAVACTLDAARHAADGALLLRMEPLQALAPAPGDWFELALPEAPDAWRWQGEAVGLPQEEFFLTLRVPWPEARAFGSLASLASAVLVHVRPRGAATPPDPDLLPGPAAGWLR